MNLKEIRTRIERRKGQREEANRRLSALQEGIEAIEKEVIYSEKAQAIIQHVAKETQSQLEFHISDIVTMALNAVFDEEYKFKIEFVVRRNKTECDMIFEKDGFPMDPMDDDAGGAVDIAGFALKIALWTLQAPRSRNTFILDEPFKAISRDLRPRTAELLEELSTRLNLQFLIVTHLDELTECADKIFNVIMVKGISKITSL